MIAGRMRNDEKRGEGNFWKWDMIARMSEDKGKAALLAVRGIEKEYDGAPLLRGISFDVRAGEIVCVLGPSGTGKTTLLRIIVGLEEAEAGEVLLDGRSLRGVPPHERGIGLMFQDLALFPHRNVFDNVAFGLRMMSPRPGASAMRQRVDEMLELVGLPPAAFAKRDVNELSGGEQQRVALARTLAPRPRLAMFDEPLGALDRLLREELGAEVRALLKRLGMTALYVTHDQDEAFALGDRLILMNAGEIAQEGTPVELYEHPASAFVARFMGLTNVIPVLELETTSERVRAETEIGTFVAEKNAQPAQEPGAGWYVLLRPGAVEAIRTASDRTENVVRGHITETQLRGGHVQVTVLPRGAQEGLVFEWDRGVQVGAEVAVEVRGGELVRGDEG